MNNEYSTPYAQTIVGEMASWKQMEANYKGICDKETFESREFSQMRLAEYDRIWNMYQGRATTRDEKAWLIIALVERRKLEKALYPNLLIRMLRRVYNSLLPALDIRRELSMAQPNSYAGDHILGQFSDNGMGQTKEFTPDPNTQRQQWGADLGKKTENHQSKGLHP